MILLRVHRSNGLLAIPTLVILLLTSVASANERLSLAGPWRVRLDNNDQGTKQQWFKKPLSDHQVIALPGTTDLAGLGHQLDIASMGYPAQFPYTRFPGVAESARADQRGFLTRTHFFLGPVWYERDVDVPTGWQGQPLTLHLERTIWKTDVWVDGQPAGTANSLATAHTHELGELSPGGHRITVRVDNRMLLNISTIPHAYGPETQTRWNGMIGCLELRSRPRVSIRRLDIFPAPDRRSARVHVRIDNQEDGDTEGRIRLQLLADDHDEVWASCEIPFAAKPGTSQAKGELKLERAAEAWDEFHAVRYRVVAVLKTESGDRHEATSRFGFRHIERRKRAIYVNGRRVFLRGTLDCAVYPRTGHPPMELPEWERILKTIKEYGFNHVRFHTWCPPEAAFEAADRIGIYLAPETAAWIDDWTTQTDGRPPAIGQNVENNTFVRDEMRRISEHYGNHPSFAQFCIGNEFGQSNTDWSRVADWVTEIKQLDSRRLYACTAARRTVPADDYWITHRVGEHRARGVGPAHTRWDFGAAADASSLPVLGHETGQRPVFPDYDDLLPKFTGPLKPFNYMRLRDLLVKNGLADQAEEFEQASARFQLVQYKAEHEAMRRTKDYAGYQLLMLNDFPGQSEALVGILDPFWESKGVIGAQEVQAWNGVTVPLARFDTFTWSTTQEFHADVEVAHHGPANLEEAGANWELVTADGRQLGRGQIRPTTVPTGHVTKLGEVRVSLGSLKRPTALLLRISVDDATNGYRLWAYPPIPDRAPPRNVTVVRDFGDATRQSLADGANVLLLAHGTRGPRAAKTGFESVYWSAGWWGNEFSSLGILCSPDHLALAGFPNDGHSDWQWYDLTQDATTFLLDGVPPGFRPIVQAVPDFHFARLLGQVFEAQVGKGRLLVCGYDLDTDLDRRLAARQFRQSLLEYVGSSDFQPQHSLSIELVRDLFTSPGSDGAGN